MTPEPAPIRRWIVRETSQSARLIQIEATEGWAKELARFGKAIKGGNVLMYELVVSELFDYNSVLEYLKGG